MKTLLTALLLLSSSLPRHYANATQVHRCQDENGKITFTQQGCPSNSIQSTQRAHNPTPGSKVERPAQTQKPSKQASQPNRLTVVGEPDDGCGNLVTGTSRREAMVRQQIKPGMTRSDVQSSLGKPARISHSNSNERYHYRSNDGTTRTITFDANGCVKGK